jgi:(R,R)-butanediol dehydrogenase / meso-butanediol dehydrogenase / diacetyl reductase
VTMWPRVIRMISSGKLPVEKIVTGRIEPDAIVEKGFRSLLNPSGQEMKVMVNVS